MKVVPFESAGFGGLNGIKIFAIHWVDVEIDGVIVS